MDIKIIIEGREYPISGVSEADEEVLRKVGKRIKQMVKDIEKGYAVRDKQDALAMCAFMLGVEAEKGAINLEKTINYSTKRMIEINQLLSDLEK